MHDALYHLTPGDAVRYVQRGAAPRVVHVTEADDQTITTAQGRFDRHDGFRCYDPYAAAEQPGFFDPDWIEPLPDP